MCVEWQRQQTVNLSPYGFEGSSPSTPTTKLMSIQVIDSLLDPGFASWIEREMTAGDFYWHYYSEIAQYGDGTQFENKNIINPNGFIHVMSNESGPTSRYYHSMAVPVLKVMTEKTGLRVARVLRVRTRMTIPIPGYTRECYSPPHVDMRDFASPYKTLVYYVNDSDGDFILFKDKYDPKTEAEIKMKNFTEETRVSPRKNRGLVFDGHTYHSGNAPMDHKHRILINFDFTVV